MVKKAKLLKTSDWNRTRLKKLIQSWRKKTILVIGDVGVDRYTQGSVDRISPEAPVPIVNVQDEWLKLGLAANVADNLATLGGKPILVGLLGRDRSAEDIRKLLSRAKVSSSSLQVDPSRRTVLKERIVSERQQLLRVDYESPHPISPKIEKLVSSRITRLMSQCDVVILQDYCKGLVTPKLAQHVFSEARLRKKPVLVDPNTKTPLSTYHGASLLTPNKREAEVLSGLRIDGRDSLLRAGDIILHRTGAKSLVITLGKEGMAVFSKQNESCTLIPTYAREVYDVSGAGDTVISVLALALATHSTLEEAAVLGNLAAGVEVGKRGTATVSPDEILKAMKDFSG